MAAVVVLPEMIRFGLVVFLGLGVWMFCPEHIDITQTEAMPEKHLALVMWASGQEEAGMGYYAGAREPENQTSTLPDEQKPNKIERKPITEPDYL